MTRWEELVESSLQDRMKLSRVNLYDFVKELNFLKEFHPCGVHVSLLGEDRYTAVNAETGKNQDEVDAENAKVEEATTIHELIEADLH